MTIPLAHILVFKTTIQTLADKRRIEATLNAHADIQEWSIDLEDVDSVLRIVSATLTPADMCSLLNQHGFTCTELD